MCVWLERSGESVLEWTSYILHVNVSSPLHWTSLECYSHHFGGAVLGTANANNGHVSVPDLQNAGAPIYPNEELTVGAKETLSSVVNAA